jgi:SAM-dependent methyltransferase
VAAPPFPPSDLANRVGQSVGADGSYAAFEAIGRSIHDWVVAELAPDWTWPGKRVLDFGCGAGRTLRHFVAEAREAEFWGCDIDAASIDWLNANLDPPIRGFVNAELPPLPRPDGSFDLIYAFSVFTHITDAWSAWLLELRRLLAPSGLLIASFLGAGHSELIADESWDEERIGMNVLRAHQGWELGGPMVLMSPWWIREHWGRAFDILELRPTTEWGEGAVLMRRRDVSPIPEELERIDPRDEREVRALQHNLRQVQREGVLVREAHAARLREYEQSRTWRLTRPLRGVARRFRRG